MAVTNTLSKILSDISDQLEALSDEEINKLESGEYSLSLRLIKAKSRSSKFDELSEEEKNNILTDLQAAKTREDGIQVIEDSMKNRRELESFARFLDVTVLKKDNIETIKEKIVEATVGARLRSNAIQGKTT